MALEFHVTIRLADKTALKNYYLTVERIPLRVGESEIIYMSNPAPFPGKGKCKHPTINTLHFLAGDRMTINIYRNDGTLHGYTTVRFYWFFYILDVDLLI